MSYDSRSKKSKKPSIEQNSSSSDPTEPKKKQCFRCGGPFSRKHLEECKAKNITCNACGIKGHLQKCYKKSGNFPKESSNQQNQSSSTGTRDMRYAAAAPPLESDFFDEKGYPKEYRPSTAQSQIGSMNILKKIPVPSNATFISEHGVEMQYKNSTSVPVPTPSPDFLFQEFLLTEVLAQSQIDSSSISDTLHLTETGNSLSKATKRTDFPLESVQNSSSDEEMREARDLNVSSKPTQSSRDSSTISISDNSTTRESIPGIKTDTPTALPIETSISFGKEGEIQEKMHPLSNNRSVMPTAVVVPKCFIKHMCFIVLYSHGHAFFSLEIAKNC